jgi:hypothetical protein
MAKKAKKTTVAPCAEPMILAPAGKLSVVTVTSKKRGFRDIVYVCQPTATHAQIVAAVSRLHGPGRGSWRGTLASSDVLHSIVSTT